MPKIIITPWRDAAELVAVRSKFYPSSSPPATAASLRDLRPDACRIVEAWKLRGHLPHAVEATALLTDAILHDDAERNSVFAIRATYAAAFSRFVTGLVDTKLGGQRGGTMFSRASAIGLPLSFVELRHEAAHRELPSLVLLRNYTNRALEWLWDYYWVKIDSVLLLLPPSTLPEKEEQNAGEESLKAQLERILQQQSDSAAGPPRKRPRTSASTSSLAQSLSSICNRHAEGAQALSRVLLEEGFLVPDQRQFGTSMEPQFSTWDNTLLSISTSHQPFLTILTEEMVNRLDPPSLHLTDDSPYTEGVYEWLEHILTSDTWQKERLLMGSVPYMLTLCHESPNHWTAMLRKILLVFLSATSKPVGFVRLTKQSLLNQKHLVVSAGRMNPTPTSKHGTAQIAQCLGLAATQITTIRSLFTRQVNMMSYSLGVRTGSLGSPGWLSGAAMMGLSTPEHVVSGRGFPVRFTSCPTPVRVLVVSGPADVEDHQFILDSLAEFLGIALS